MENLSNSSSASLKVNDVGSGDSSPLVVQFEKIYQQYKNVSGVLILPDLIDECLTKIVVGSQAKGNAEELAMLATTLVDSLSIPAGKEVKEHKIKRVKLDVIEVVNHAGVLLKFEKALTKTGRAEYIETAGRCKEMYLSLNNLQNFLRRAEKGTLEEFLVGYVIDKVSEIMSEYSSNP